MVSETARWVLIAPGVCLSGGDPRCPAVIRVAVRGPGATQRGARNDSSRGEDGRLRPPTAARDFVEKVFTMLIVDVCVVSRLMLDR
jgi:hypothetical protein